MSVVQLDLQKIEQLLNSATNERQRKMYQALLDKALSQFENSTADKASPTTPSTEKKAKTKTNQKSETQTKTKTAKQKKATRKSATIKADSATQSATPVTERTYVANPTAPLRASELNSGVASSSTQLTPEESDLQTKTEPLPKEQPKQQPDSARTIFQALGTLIATPHLQDDLLKVTIEDCEYNLSYVRAKGHQAYMSLSSELEENGSKEMFLKLYPQATFSGSDKKPRLSFSLVKFSLNGDQLDNYPQGFVLRGIWQYIPQSKFPVISIYRNRNQLGFFKRLNKSRQFSFARPCHLPVVWSAPVEPFKFNPQAEKGERTSHDGESAESFGLASQPPSVSSQMPRYFVQVRATIKDGLYVVEEMLGEPTLKIPRFIKVSKSKVSKSSATT